MCLSSDRYLEYTFNDSLLSVFIDVGTYRHGVSGEILPSDSHASCKCAFSYNSPFPTLQDPSIVSVDCCTDSWLSELLGPPVTKNCVVLSITLDCLFVEVRGDIDSATKHMKEKLKINTCLREMFDMKVYDVIHFNYSLLFVIFCYIFNAIIAEKKNKTTASPAYPYTHVRKSSCLRVFYAI